MAASVDDIRKHAEERLLELQPYLEEAHRLRQVLDVTSADGGKLLRDREPPRTVASGRRAPQGANKRKILACLAAHPGAAAPEVARHTGLKRPIVASTMSRLKRTGELLDCEGGGARVPEGWSLSDAA